MSKFTFGSYNIRPAPENKFKANDVKKHIKYKLNEELRDKEYNEKELPILTNHLTSVLLQFLKDLNLEKYKFMVSVIIAEQRGQGLKRFVFAPSCRGVSAKRSQMRSHNNHGGMSDDLSQERHPLEADFGELAPIESQRLTKRFTDLLKTSLLRRSRSKDSTRYNLLLNSLDNLLASDGVED
ncbi:unnamed protein product [Oppiella nova]|uniref:Uncharacterized protein n=1 Tax=Oppiella nova TaxID=334625 RepID=A0A7R9M9U6_9ACAR|nr:unnamed protein product [Oppiella nova]CAG2173199.1 unnamed protein product [Oppiella nova]